MYVVDCYNDCCLSNCAKIFYHFEISTNRSISGEIILFCRKKLLIQVKLLTIYDQEAERSVCCLGSRVSSSSTAMEQFILTADDVCS